MQDICPALSGITKKAAALFLCLVVLVLHLASLQIVAAFVEISTLVVRKPTFSKCKCTWTEMPV